MVATKNKTASCTWMKAHLHLKPLPEMLEEHRMGDSIALSRLAERVYGSRMHSGRVRKISDDTHLGQDQILGGN